MLGECCAVCLATELAWPGFSRDGDGGILIANDWPGNFGPAC